MKKILLSIMTLAAVAGCSQVSDEPIQATTRSDSLSVAVGTLLAVDSYYSNLSDYKEMIAEAVNDYTNGNIHKIQQVYAYVNAVEILNQTYLNVDDRLDPDILKRQSMQMLAVFSDSMEISKVNKKEDEAQQYIRSYVMSARAKYHEAFLADIDKQEGVKKTESGLRYQIETPGKAKVGNTDKVKVLYRLFDYEGNIIDSSNNGPFTVELPSGVVPGFAEAIMLAGYGGKIRAYVPAELGYGSEGAGKIEPGQTLIFNIEVLDK